MDLKWQADAACVGTDPELWFSEDDPSIVHAQSICAQCTVRDECIAEAIASSTADGIRGGVRLLKRTWHAQWARIGPGTNGAKALAVLRQHTAVTVIDLMAATGLAAEPARRAILDLVALGLVEHCGNRSNRTGPKWGKLYRIRPSIPEHIQALAAQAEGTNVEMDVAS